MNTSTSQISGASAPVSVLLESIKMTESLLKKAQVLLRIASGSTSHVSICMFDSGLTVSWHGGRPSINSALIAEEFTPICAQSICRNVRNGHGEFPRMVSKKDYYSFMVNKYTEILNDLKINADGCF